MERKRKTADLKFLAEFLEEMEWETEVIGEDMANPVLAAVLPMEEDYEATVVFTYIDLPEEDAEYTKYLQIYFSLEPDISEIPAEELLTFANQMNLLTLMGHFVYVPAADGQPQRVDFRYVLPLDAEKLPDEGIVGETLLNLMKYTQTAEALLLRRIAGDPMEKVLAEIQAVQEGSGK